MHHDTHTHTHTHTHRAVHDTHTHTGLSSAMTQQRVGPVHELVAKMSTYFNPKVEVTSAHPSPLSLLQVRLEEKQRAKRRKREAIVAQVAEATAAGDLEEAKRLQDEGSFSPLWFKKECDPLTGSMLHVYQGGYWEAKMKGDWGREMPDIF